MWRKLYFQNERFEQGIQRLLRSGIVQVSQGTGLIEPTGQSMDYNSNWLFFGNTTANRDCYLWHQIMFNHFDLVPEFCKMNCYKIVVKVRNFVEAIHLYNAMHTGPAVLADLTLIHGKVGIDERYYSDGFFNGFIYCNGLEDALEKYAAVSELVSANVDTSYAQSRGLPAEIPIIIKRSCTEFEQKYGATNNEFWSASTPDERDLQNHIEDIFVKQTVAAVQPDWLKNKIIAKMTKWANTVGDKSWIEYFGLDFLTMKAVTYHETSVPKDSATALTTPSKED